MKHSSTNPESRDGELEVLFFDGECGFCHASVRFLCRRHQRHQIHFSPLQGETFARLKAEGAFHSLLGEMGAKPLPQSLIFRAQDGSLFLRSDGVVETLLRLRGGWAVLGWILWPIPRFLRDLPYRLVAALRTKFWAKPEGHCPLLPPQQQQRFLP